MNLPEIFSKSPQSIKPFQLFGIEHILALVFLIVFILTCTLLARKNEKFRAGYKWFLLISIPIQEVAYKIWAGVIGGTDFAIIFSLHLCSAAIILLVILLIKYNQNIFEIVYFWGLGGATQALLTPDITYAGFPHFRFFQVFFSHGMIVAGVLYFMFAERKVLRPGSFLRIIAITNIYTIIVFVVNFITGSNFLFLNRKPETASLMDALGPWPIYLIWLEVLLLVIFGILYIPIYISRKHVRKFSLNLYNQTE